MSTAAPRRSFVVTGGHAGLGFQCACTLAKEYGADLVLAGRDPERMAAAADKLRSETGAVVSLVQLDLGALASVRTAAAEIRRCVASGEIAPLHGIVCNAGFMAAEQLGYSDDGFEQVFAVNHLGHFLFVDLLLPMLSEPGRVLVVSSDTHDATTLGGRMAKPGRPDAFSLAYPERAGAQPLKAMQRYATSKLCNVLFAYELDRRLRRAQRDIAVLAFNPGFTPGTGFLRNGPVIAKHRVGLRMFTWVIRRLGDVVGDKTFSGAAMGRVAGDARYQAKSGSYFECDDLELHERRSATSTYDETLAHKLWVESAQLTGAAQQ